MSGIAGFYQVTKDYNRTPQALERLEKMTESLNRRGPKSRNTWLSSHAGLTHTNSHTLSEHYPTQPFILKNQKGCAILTYDGSLTNTAELKNSFPFSDKEAAGSLPSDAELLLTGYLAKGSSFFKKLRGMFSFALYDINTDILYLVRDQLGLKPLFYQETHGELVFGSEAKALFSSGITPEINSDSFGEIFGLGPARTPGNGVFSHMLEVKPGHFLTISPDASTSSGFRIKDTTYWQLTSHPHEDSYNTTIEKAASMVKSSVINNIPSDMRFCTLLSGGLDSSLVSAICSEEQKRKGLTLDTYSFDFTGNHENFKPNSFQSSLDRPFVEQMTAYLGSSHTFLECDSLTQTDDLSKAVDARDLPCMADVESSLLYFCSLVSRRHDVALTGECADEIFGGYPWFHNQALWEKGSFPWSYDMEARTSLLDPDFVKTNHIVEYAQDAYRTSLAKTPYLEEETGEDRRRREVSFLTLEWFMATLGNRMDRTSNYSGIEARCPFADCDLLSYVFQIPWDMKSRGGQPKSLLIEAGKTLLPEQVLLRKKSPFPKTYDKGYELLLAHRLRAVMNNPASPILNIINKDAVDQFLTSPKDYGKPWYGQLMAGPQMLAYLLQTNYWMEKYKL